MKKRVWGSAVAAAVAFVATAAYGGNLTFTIENDSDYIISSFQSNEGDGWSKNWLSDDVHAGAKTGMQFLQDGPCKIQVRVGWRTTDGGQEIGEPWNIDICDAHTVHFDGKKVTYE